MNNNKEIKIYGVRPLLEAINSGKSINKVIFKRNNSLNPNQKKIINILKENSIPFSFAPSEKFKKLQYR